VREDILREALLEASHDELVVLLLRVQASSIIPHHVQEEVAAERIAVRAVELVGRDVLCSCRGVVCVVACAIVIVAGAVNANPRRLWRSQHSQ
jgi:hypothetical protein